MTGLVLHLGHQDGLAPERRRAGQPVAFRLHTDDLGMRVLRDLTDQGLAVTVGHPVARLNPRIVGDRPVEEMLEVGVADPGGL